MLCREHPEIGCFFIAVKRERRVIMLKSCSYCGHVHDSKFDCGRKPKRIKEGNKKDRFRWTMAWKNKREEIKERDLYLCVVCKENGRIESKDLSVHHIEPLEERFDLRLENDNLITLCKNCHKAADMGMIKRSYLHQLIKKINNPP